MSAGPAADIGELWMVVRMDNCGTRFLVEKGLSAAAAKQAVEDILSRHRKPHGQDYSCQTYDAAERPNFQPGDVIPVKAL